MKVYLDDQREAPAGWIQVRWPEEAVALLLTGKVTELSLDFDLGDGERRTGLDVLWWLEAEVAERGFVPPTIHLHSASPSGRRRMELILASIERYRQTRR